MQTIKPNLFIPGAAKSGTTSLHELLNLHPDICMSTLKEPVFWNSDHYNNANKIAWYNALFNEPYARIIGESTTSYMYFPEFISRIKKEFETFPKFIFILRNPIDRCYSHYWYLVGRGQEKRDFKTSILEDNKREFSKYGYKPDYYYHFGRYAYWLNKFYENFDPSQIKIITSEQLKSERLKTINNCFKFLDVSELKEIPEIVTNKSKKLENPRLYHFVQKTLSGYYQFTKFPKNILPKKLTQLIKSTLKTNKIIYQNKPLNYPKLSELDRKWVKELYHHEIIELKSLTDLNFDMWTDFND